MQEGWKSFAIVTEARVVEGGGSFEEHSQLALSYFFTADGDFMQHPIFRSGKRAGELYLPLFFSGFSKINPSIGNAKSSPLGIRFLPRCHLKELLLAFLQFLLDQNSPSVLYPKPHVLLLVCATAGLKIQPSKELWSSASSSFPAYRIKRGIARKE